MAQFEKKKETEKTIWKKTAQKLGKDKAGPRKDSAESENTKGNALRGHHEILADARSPQKAEIVTDLQRRYGNTYVQKLLKSKAIQAKLTVNPPDDGYEKEADQVAEKIAGTGSQVQRQPVEEEEVQRQPNEEDQVQTLAVSDMQRQPLDEEEVQTKGAGEVQRQPNEEEEMQAKKSGGQTPEVSAGMEGRIKTARGSGETLPDSVRAPMEQHFGRNFSEVRVHADSEADDLSRQLGARAFTTGQDIFFRSGDYQPHSTEGMKLLSHEMAHVIQQGGASIQRKPAETGKDASTDTKSEAESELSKSRDKALGNMSPANIKAMLYNVAHCQEIGAEAPARDALDRAADKALEQLKQQTKAFKVETSSRETATALLEQLAKVQLFGAKDGGKEGQKAFEKLLAWAQVQLTNAVKQLYATPSAGAAREVLQRAALVQMLGGDASLGLAAVKAWADMEKT